MLQLDAKRPKKTGHPQPWFRLGKRCFMRLSSLGLAAVLIFSSAAFAQHSSGGGSGGGGSHGSSGGSSSSGSSGSSHSSGGSASHGSSASHGAKGHSSTSGSASSHTHLSHSNPSHSIRQSNAAARSKTVAPGKKTFFSFLRRPFRKSEPKPKPVADLRRPICFKGPCPVCPAGQVHAGGGCVGILVTNNRNFCSHREVWNGGACLLQNPFLGDCVGLRTVLERQAQRMQAAEAARQNACSTGSSQECSDLSSTAQSEGSLYRSWQDRYNQCQQRSLRAYPFSGLGGWSNSPGLLFDRLGMDLDHR